MNKIARVGIAVIIVSLLANVFLAIEVVSIHKKNGELQQSLHLHDKVLEFANLFTTKVLGAQGEVSFEDRLKIEDAVRDTHDKEIYDEWQKFVNVKTEVEGREEIKTLLQLIVYKLSH